MAFVVLVAGVVAVISLVIAPFWAISEVWGAGRSWRARMVAWLGLTIGFWMTWTLPARALWRGIGGAEISIVYPLVALPIAAASLFLGRRLIAVHRHRLHGHSIGVNGLGWACLAFAVVVAIALSPYVVGAPLPPRPTALEGTVARPGHVGVYLFTVVPVSIWMAAQALMLLTTSLVSRAGACLALFGLVALPPLLRGSRFDEPHLQRVDRAAVIARADALDAPRQAALREIVSGRLPALGSAACPPSELGSDWAGLAELTGPPGSRDDVLRYDSRWRELSGHGIDGKGLVRDFDTRDPEDSLESMRNVLLKARFIIADEEGRQVVPDAAGIDRWDHDAMLVIRTGFGPRAVERDESTGCELGELTGSLWLWSYRKQAFVCGSQVEVPPARIPDAEDRCDAERWQYALKMRAVAIGMKSLRAVTAPRRRSRRARPPLTAWHRARPRSGSATCRACASAGGRG